jgi:hypothetical protein
MSQIRKLIESLDSIIDGKESNADLPQVKKPKTKNKFLGKPFKPKEGGIVEALTAQYEDFVKNKAVPDSKEKLTMSQRDDGAWQVKNEKGDVVSKGTKADCNDYISKKNSALNDAKLDEGSTSKEKQKRPYKTMAQHKEAGKAYGAKVDADKKAKEAEKIGRKKTNEADEVPGYGKWFNAEQKKKDTKAANRKNTKDAQKSKIELNKKSPMKESADGKWIVYRSADDFKTFPTYRAATAFHNKFGERGYKVASAAWFYDKMKPQGAVTESPIAKPDNAHWAGAVARAKGAKDASSLWNTHQNVRNRHMAQLARDAGHTPTPDMTKHEPVGEAFGETSGPDTDSILEYLTSAYRMLAGSGLFSSDGESELKAIYEMLRSPLMEGDFSKFDEMYDYMSGRYPDIFDELVGQMYLEAGLGDHGTYEQFMAKVGGGAGLGEGIGDTIKRGVKNIKRGMQGWGQLNDVPDDDPRLLPGAKDTPHQMVARNKGYDDETVRRLARPTKSSFPFGGDDTTSPHSPRGLQKRVLDREMKKRGLGEEVVPTKTGKLAKMRSMLDKLSATLAKTKQSLGGKQGVVDEEMPVAPTGVKTAMPPQPAQPAQPAQNAQPAPAPGAAPANAPAAPAPGTPVPPQGSATNAATTPGEQVKALVQTLATNPAAAKQLGTKLNTIR